MMVFTSIYGVVDGLFISNYVGKSAFAAVNIVMPFIMILGAVGFMIGTGGSALVAKTLGEGRTEKANEYFSMMIEFTIICGIIMTILGIIFLRPVSYLLGATDAMIDDCVSYGRIALLSNTCFMLQSAFHTFFTTAEKPKLGLATTVAAGVTNMVFDALFVAGFGWGVVGAALATAMSEMLGGLAPLVYFLRPNSSLLRLRRVKLQAKILVKACSNGASELMSNISSSLVSMLYNFQLMRYAGENGVAAYGVLMYIQFIFIAVFIGYTIGVSPVVSYNYGSGNDQELKSLFRKSMLLVSIGGILMMLLAQGLASPLSKLFVGYDAELMEMTIHAFQLFSFSFILAGINIFASAFFTAFGNGAISAAISFLRTLVFQMLSVLILPRFFGLDGIWWAITVAEVCACVVSGSFLFAKRKQYHYA
jgi:putative MATE family efflux protein